jgi:hypothetical protein
VNRPKIAAPQQTANDGLQTKTSRNISSHLLSPAKDTGPTQPAETSEKKRLRKFSMGQANSGLSFRSIIHTVPTSGNSRSS